MAYTIEPLDVLSSKLAKLPGIGSKSAQRLAFHIVSLTQTQATELADAIISAKQNIVPCDVCGAFTSTSPCSICTDTHRSSSIICVVKEPRDVLALEKMREFKGRYHVLGGVISPMDGVGPDDLKLTELQERIKSENVQEVVIATNLDIEGEATANYILSMLAPLGITISRIAYGVPVGGNLEYTDELTLIKAFEGRRKM